MPRYFFGENASRPIRAGGQQFAFEILSCAGGTHQGVVKVADDQAEMFLAVAKNWVSEITEEAYNDALKKKENSRGAPNFPDLMPPQRLGPPLKGRGAVVVDGSSVVRAQAEELPKDSHEAITLGRAEPPPAEPPAPKGVKNRRLNHLQKRGMTKASED